MTPARIAHLWASALTLASLLGGCSASDLAGYDIAYQLKLLANQVPATAMWIEPQVWVEDPYTAKWKSSAPIKAASLANLTKRDSVSVLLNVRPSDAGDRVAPAARLLDDKLNLVGVGGGQLALSKDTSYAVTVVEVSDSRQLPLQVAKFEPASAPSGRNVTMYGWGFSPEAGIQMAGIPVTEKQWLSSVEMVVRVPAGVPTGAIEVQVRNPDGTLDIRQDLLTGQ